MSYEDIIYDKRDGIATITLNRPNKLNAIRGRTAEDITAALADAALDNSIGAVVITGAGEKAFSAGGDVDEMYGLDPQTGRAFADRFLNAILAIRRIPKPVIAAVKGICVGGGNEIAIVCDLTIATEDARFGQAGPKVGSVPIISGTQLLPRIVGEKRAREIVFLCQQYTAQEAYEMGMINKVVPRAEFDTAVRSWCDTILSLSPQALRLAKVSFNFEADQLYASFLHGLELLVATYGTAECKEGMRAFLEKRKPDFAQFRK